jgi:hypothetical protein
MNGKVRVTTAKEDVMLRVFTDFQAVDLDGACFILRHEGTDIENFVSSFNLSKGDRVVLDAYEDFEVIGTLNFKFVELLGKQAWVAYPDWATRKDKPNIDT